MARRCEILGKRPLVGNAVSHANNKTKRRQLPNLQSKRFWSAAQGRFIRLTVSAKGIKTVSRIGVDQALSELRKRKLH
jgi:large subunit ribosomal protein L28